MKQNKNLLGTIQLLLAALIWGSAFVAQSEGMNHIGPLTFMSVRFLLGGLVLLPIIALRKNKIKASDAAATSSGIKKALTGGIICGILLTFASGFQQFGILYTSVSKAGFITTLYVVFIPICGLFTKRKPSPTVWVAVIASVFGLYMLCMSDDLRLSAGDVLVFFSAICYTAQILAVDRYSQNIDPITLSCIQFFTVAAVSAIPAFITEQPTPSAIVSAWLPLLYAGILSSGVAFTLQVVAQRYTEPTIAAITMSFESVFSALSGWLILNESLSLRELIGCVIMFAAIITAQLPKDLFRRRVKA